MERVRSVRVSIVVDTNKKTVNEELEPREEETWRAFACRVEERIVELLQGDDPTIELDLEELGRRT